MAGKIKSPLWLKNSKVRWGILAGIWLVFLVTIVIPTWKTVVAKNAEIGELEVRLATMDEWTVAGLWLAESVNERQLQVDTAFGRLFPDERGRAELFLDLARIADNSGVVGFDLSEKNIVGMAGNDVWSDGSSMNSSGDNGNYDDDMNGGTGDRLPSVELSSFRVQAHFSGDYKRIAQFMGGLKSIERAMKVHSLVIRPDKDGVQVDLELDIYVSQANQS